MNHLVFGFLRKSWLLTLLLLGVMFAGFVLIMDRNPSEMELILQDPLQFDAPADQCESEICTSLVSLINHAEESIDFAVYGARMQTDILDALLHAQDRGIMIRGYVDKDANNENYYTSTEDWMDQIPTIRDDYQRETQCHSDNFGTPPCTRPKGFEGPLQCVAYDLGDDQILIGGYASSQPIASMMIMHNKFFIVDGQRVWTGSANISNSGTGGYNANAVVILYSKDIAQVYTKEFDQLWQRNGACDKQPNGIEEFELASGTLTTWFSPQDRSLRYGVKSLIARAEKNIHVAVFFLTEKYLTADLIAAHQRGVDVRVIIDATSAKNEYSKHEVLREAGIPVKIENWGGKMHMKTASVDEEFLILGSMNWTSAGQMSNDENTLLVRSEKWTNHFDDYFDGLWNTIPKSWQDQGTRPDPESHDSGTSCFDGVDNDFDNLADEDDPGCSKTDAPPLPPLPQHQIITTQRYEKIKKQYRMMWPTSCDPSYPDWYVCLSRRFQTSCDAIPYRRFSAISDDPLHLDGDGDGIACEG